MTDKYERDRQYQYTANASKVVQRERTAPQANLPSGESESLRGRELRGFGDLVSKEADPERQKLEKKAEEKKKKQKNKKKKKPEIVEVARDAINAEIHDDVFYTPRTEETRKVYEQILYTVQTHMGDTNMDTLKQGVDETLAILKTDGPKDTEKKKSIEFFLNKIADETFNTLTILAAKITDYDPETQMNEGKAEELLEADINLDKEGEDSESSDSDVYVKDDELEEQKGQFNPQDKKEKDEDMSDEEEALKVGEESALWIENQLQKFIKNQSKAKEIFSILNIESPEECSQKVNDLVKFYET